MMVVVVIIKNRRSLERFHSPWQRVTAFSFGKTNKCSLKSEQIISYDTIGCELPIDSISYQHSPLSQSAHTRGVVAVVSGKGYLSDKIMTRNSPMFLGLVMRGETPRRNWVGYWSFRVMTV